jgi:hypothetical protein
MRRTRYAHSTGASDDRPCGRRPEARAPAAASELRRLLCDELGLDVSPAVRDLEQQILVDDPSLGGRPVPSPADGLRPSWMTRRA